MYHLLLSLLGTVSFISRCSAEEGHGVPDKIIEKRNGEEFSGWQPYISALTIPSVVDMRKGGSLEMSVSNLQHSWGAGFEGRTSMYGFHVVGEDATFPGPTILVAKGVEISITWNNNISGLHVLQQYMGPKLTMPPTDCYPLSCGVPIITHVHGMEVPAKYDGVPYQAVFPGEHRKDVYGNTQMSSTHVYHDHAMGMTRLNHWAGMLGTYLIEDTSSEFEQAMSALSCDIPLVMTDTMIETDGGDLLYPTSPCSPVITRWAPEAYGSVTAVNGVVMPFVDIPAQQCRLRLINGANSRNYQLSIPFYQQCQVIGTDMGMVNEPHKMTEPEELILFPLERYDLLCDFSNVNVGSVFNITNPNDNVATQQLFNDIIQVRIKSTDDASSPVERVDVPSVTNRIKNLKDLYDANPGTQRNLTLKEVTNDDDCPQQLQLLVNDVVSNFEDKDYVTCEIGKVEKWVFKNPTADVHPWHWHAIAVQCGDTEETINTNELKDTVQIPNLEDDYENPTQVCYVACTPNNYLLEGSTTEPTAFEFDTTEPYVVHCHMLEHEEHSMMTYFKLSTSEELAVNENGLK